MVVVRTDAADGRMGWRIGRERNEPVVSHAVVVVHSYQVKPVFISTKPQSFRHLVVISTFCVIWQQPPPVHVGHTVTRTAQNPATYRHETIDVRPPHQLRQLSAFQHIGSVVHGKIQRLAIHQKVVKRNVVPQHVRDICHIVKAIPVRIEPEDFTPVVVSIDGSGVYLKAYHPASKIGKRHMVV